MLKTSTCVICMCMITLTSCSFLNNFKKESEAEKKIEEFLVYLDEGDTEAMKKMLCKKTSSLPDIDNQILGAIDFFQGNIVSQGRSHAGGGGEYITFGEIIKLDFYPYISDIKTDANKTYQVRIHYYFVYKDNEEKIGIAYFSIQELVDGSYYNHDKVYVVYESDE